MPTDKMNNDDITFNAAKQSMIGHATMDFQQLKIGMPKSGKPDAIIFHDSDPTFVALDLSFHNTCPITAEMFAVNYAGEHNIHYTGISSWQDSEQEDEWVIARINFKKLNTGDITDFIDI